MTLWNKKTFDNIFKRVDTLEDIVKSKDIQLKVAPNEKNRYELKLTEANLKRYLKIEEKYWRHKVGMK